MLTGSGRLQDTMLHVTASARTTFVQACTSGTADDRSCFCHVATSCRLLPEQINAHVQLCIRDIVKLYGLWHKHGVIIDTCVLVPLVLTPAMYCDYNTVPYLQPPAPRTHRYQMDALVLDLCQNNNNVRCARTASSPLPEIYICIARAIAIVDAIAR